MVLLVLTVCGRGAEGERVWHKEEGFRWAELQHPTEGKPGFAQMSSSLTGILFTNRIDELSLATNRVLGNGSGVAVGDYDGDGLPDLFFCGLNSPNVLYRNLGGWKFRDTTAEAGLGQPHQRTRGAVFADINGDGFLDLVVSTAESGIRCYLNDRSGKFAEITADAGTRSSYGSTTLALSDVDGNGTLDLYIANYRPNDIRDRGRLKLPSVKGKPVIPPSEKDHFLFRDGQLMEYGQPDQLLMNDGQGHFEQLSWTNGAFLDETGHALTGPPLDWGLTATFRDVNGDLAPDLYVCNDYWTPDRFWINDGHGHFRAIDPLALRRTSSSSMGVDFADLDHDGHLDFFVVDMLSSDPRLRKRQAMAEMPPVSMIGMIDNRPQVMQNTLFENRGDGTFAEMAGLAGVAASDWSWSPIFVDVDLDGYEDLLISAGHFRDVQDLDAQAEIRARQHSWGSYTNEAERQRAYTAELMDHYRLYPLLDMPIKAFRNSSGRKFEPTTTDWGLNQPGVHHGMAMGDFDGDGDLDLVVNNLNGAAGIYRNESTEGRIEVRLKGRAPNTQGIGAKVTLLNGAVTRQSTEIISGGRYLSGSEAVAVFASGEHKDGMRLEIQWRNGTVRNFSGIQANRIYEIEEVGGEVRTGKGEAQVVPIFEDVSNALSHTHPESAYNDFERQPLLPFKLSQAGPGVAWFDLDGDGLEDLVVGAGAGNPVAVYHNDGKGAFSKIGADIPVVTESDWSGLAGMYDATGAPFLLAGITGYESAGSNALRRFVVRDGKLHSGESALPALNNVGAVAWGCSDQPGRMNLFVAGSVLPGRYPGGASSRLYQFDGQRLSLDAPNSAALGNVGIVNGAVWSDLTGDGIQELVLACEWGPIRVFQQRKGKLFEISDELGLSKWTGWWRGVTTGDIDGDGRMDIIASNWGLNSPYQATLQKPLVMYFGETSQPGVVDLIETEYDLATGRLMPRRSLAVLSASMPFLLDLFASHRKYSEATLEQGMGERMPLVRRVEAATLASTVFFNRGSKFEPVALPHAAQFAPAFSVNVADLDGDGNEDVFLSQNFFATQPETPRLDGGRGLVLRGLGGGKLQALTSVQSGIKVDGEQRGAALGDFDGDGRVDLVVTQNGASTKLYHNRGGPVGLRVKLKGPSWNLRGAGAVIRLVFNDHSGPAREVHAGSGYWSQDGLTQVLATPTRPTGLWVRWPGGLVTTSQLPSSCLEVEVDWQGKLLVRY